MTPLRTFTSRRKLGVYLKDVWPGSTCYTVLDGHSFVVHDHCRDGRVIANDYPPYHVFRLPGDARLLLTWQEAEKEKKSKISVDRNPAV